MLAAERPAPLKNVRRDISTRQAPPSPLRSAFGSAILGAPLMSCVCLSVPTSPALNVGVPWHPQMITNDVRVKLPWKPSWDKRAALLKTPGQQTGYRPNLPECGIGGTAGSLCGPPARSRPVVGYETLSITLVADRTPLVCINFVPGPHPTVPLRRGRRYLGLG